MLKIVFLYIRYLYNYIYNEFIIKIKLKNNLLIKNKFYKTYECLILLVFAVYYISSKIVDGIKMTKTLILID